IARIAPLSACPSFFLDPAPADIHTLSLHDALPICSAHAEIATVTVTATSGRLSQNVPILLKVVAVKTGTVAVDLTSAYNLTGIYTDGSTFDETSSLDGGGFALPEQPVGATQEWDGVLFRLGPANAPDDVTGETVTLTAGKF